MIAARGLTKRYGPHRALDNASFEVKKGEIVGFLGPNGAGKSTTMKILTCYIAPSEGTATIKGADIWDDPIGARASIGYLPESTPLYGEMLVAEYLEFMGEMRGLQKDALRKAIRKVVEECNIGSFYAQEIRTLSKGQKQRVGLAQALIHEPPILILDEPMSRPRSRTRRSEIRDLIRELGKERTVMLSTHNLHGGAGDLPARAHRGRQGQAGRRRPRRSALASRKPHPGLPRSSVKKPEKRRIADASARDAFGRRSPGVRHRARARRRGARGEASRSCVEPGKDDLRAELFKAAVAGALGLLEHASSTRC
jgi:ABC-type Na+ transport system ATPase subunit NatA